MEKNSTLDNFRILKTLGKGYSGKVKLGRDLETGKTFALKILCGEPTELEHILEGLKKEFEIVKKLNHSSIIRLVDLRLEGSYTSGKTGLTSKKIYAVIELAPKGELFDVIFHAGAFDENLARFYFKQLVAAVEHLHKNEIAHRDLKPENLLLDDNLMMKLIDFGFATFVEPGKKNRTRLGTARYMAPELLYKLPYDAKKADIFAMGVILFVFFSGHPPFLEATENDPYYFKLFVKNPLQFWVYHSKQNLKRNYSISFQQLVSGMIHFQASDRYSIEDVKNSEWFNEPVNLNLAMENMQGYMKRMAHIVNGNDEINPPPKLLKGFSEKSKILPHQKLNIKEIKIETLQSSDEGTKCDIRVKVDTKADMVRLVINVAKGNNAEAYQDMNSLKLSYPAEDLYGAAILEVVFYKLEGENVYGADIINSDSDYFDFQTRKAKLIEDIHFRFGVI